MIVFGRSRRRGELPIGAGIFAGALWIVTGSVGIWIAFSINDIGLWGFAIVGVAFLAGGLIFIATDVIRIKDRLRERAANSAAKEKD